MDNNDQIAALQEQRRELNRLIRELRNEGELNVGPVRIARKQPPNNDIWTLSYKVPLEHFGGLKHGTQYRTLARGCTKAEVIRAIPEIISDLQVMYDAAALEEGIR